MGARTPGFVCSKSKAGRSGERLSDRRSPRLWYIAKRLVLYGATCQKEKTEQRRVFEPNDFYYNRKLPRNGWSLATELRVSRVRAEKKSESFQGEKHRRIKRESSQSTAGQCSELVIW